MFQPYAIRIDHGRLSGEPRCRVFSNKQPIFSWAVLPDCKSKTQNAYQIIVTSDNTRLWDTGWVISAKQTAKYGGSPLPFGERIQIEIRIQDQDQRESLPVIDYFYIGQTETWDATWITSSENEARRTIYFTKNFTLESDPEDAYLMVCGLGYHQVTLNGRAISTALLDPAYSDYTKTCYYVMFPELCSFLNKGENNISCVVGGGWRQIDSPFLRNILCERGIKFDGSTQLSAMLYIKSGGVWRRFVQTDASWQWSYGPLVSNNLYDGVCYDARITKFHYQPVECIAEPGGNMLLQSLEPIRRKEIYHPLSVILLGEDTYIVDFGQNMAGFVSLKLPCKTQPGQTITVSYAELLKEEGDLFTEPLREAKATDQYICSGNETGRSIWEPEFTYHGFRYARISGYGQPLTHDSLYATAIYTDIAQEHSYFTCGSALVNQIHKNAVLCEKSNLHSILTDCPQRDERMGWMNDATVRFEATPYNFDIGRLFPKVLQDIMDTQDRDGSITCTAPFVVGGRPADPVCSSFLIAGLQSLMHTGNTEVIAKVYDSFKAWESCLLSHSDDYIVNYSYYGDWAAPAYACIGDDGANSSVTPGIFMSTGYSYYNCKLLERFARILGKEEDAAYYYDTAGKIRDAFLRKWFCEDTGIVASGSQACQIFPLWLGLIPSEFIGKTAAVLRKNLVDNNYRITTGNLCTRYLFDVLTTNGYVDDAWNIITDEEYPTIGYMIQNEATTIWERFELKKNPGMNSHNHPMYGAVDYWLYAYIAGIQPTSPGWETFTVKPYFPSKLLSAHAQVDTPMGPVTVKWLKQYGKTQLYVTVPFGASAVIDFNGENETVGSGFHYYNS